jgi:hypothetical protein
MKASNMPKADFVTAIVLMVTSLTIIVLSITMPRMEELGANPYSAPGIVPGFLGVVIFLLSLILLIRSIRQQGYQLKLTGGRLQAFFREESPRRVLLTVVISIIYGGFLLGKTPYLLATFFYILIFVTIFEYRFDQPWRAQQKTLAFALVQAVLVAGAVAAVFRYLFLVKLP